MESLAMDGEGNEDEDMDGEDEARDKDEGKDNKDEGKDNKDEEADGDRRGKGEDDRQETDSVPFCAGMCCVCIPPGDDSRRRCTTGRERRRGPEFADKKSKWATYLRTRMETLPGGSRRRATGTTSASASASARRWRWR